MATPDEFPLLWVVGCEMKTQVLLNQVPFHKMKMIQEDQNGRGGVMKQERNLNETRIF